MGLDGMEIILEVEEEFDIRIPDEESWQMRTVGDLYRSVLSRIELRSSGRCASHVAFNRFRRTLIEVLGTPRGAIRPATRLEEIMPADARRVVWNRLGKTLGHSIPPLVRPPWLVTIVYNLIIVWTFAIAIGLGRAGAAPRDCVIVALILVTGLSVFAALATRHFATLIPAEVATARDAIVGPFGMMDYALARREPDVRIDARQVFEILRRIIALQLGVPIEKVTEEAEFVKDLGLS